MVVAAAAAAAAVMVSGAARTYHTTATAAADLAYIYVLHLSREARRGTGRWFGAYRSAIIKQKTLVSLFVCVLWLTHQQRCFLMDLRNSSPSRPQRPVGSTLQL